MQTSHYTLDIPLGTGLNIEIVVDLTKCTAVAAVVDHYLGETVKDEEFLGLADAVMATHFMQPMPAIFRGEHRRDYRVAHGWSIDGWRGALGQRVSDSWIATDVEETFLGRY